MGTTRSGRAAESVAVEVSRNTSKVVLLLWPRVSTPVKLSWSCLTPPSPVGVATRLQRVKSITPV